MDRNTLKRTERLKSTRIIGKLINSGDTITVFPLKLFWRVTNSDQPAPVRIAVAIPARNIRNAVDRNRLKRRIREAYRLNKHILLEFLSHKNIYLNFVFLYLPKTIISYDQIAEALLKILMSISSRLENASANGT